RPGRVERQLLLLPRGLRLLPCRRRVVERALGGLELRLHGRACLLLFGRGEVERRLTIDGAGAVRTLDVRRRGEERHQLEVLLLAEWVVLVVVALRARECRAEPHRRRGVDAIDEDLV